MNEVEREAMELRQKEYKSDSEMLKLVTHL